MRRNWVSNPKGNPNIGQISKEKSTGPKTKLGKLYSTLHLMKTGKHSRILNKFRKCDVCPFRAKQIKNYKYSWFEGGLKAEEIIKNSPAKCPHYEKGKKKCEMSKEHYIQFLKEKAHQLKQKLKIERENLFELEQTKQRKKDKESVERMLKEQAKKELLKENKPVHRPMVTNIDIRRRLY